MAHAPLLQPGNESPGYYVPAADASTQTNEDFIFLEPTRDASTQTTEEDFILLRLHTFRDVGTQTTEDDFDLLSRGQLTRNISIAISESTIDTNETVQFANPVEKNSRNLRDEKMFLCKVCEKDLGGHSEMRGITKSYHCCVCRYRSDKRASLQRHINIHCAKNKCNICTREYTEGEPHNSKKTCNVCKKEFPCKTFLDQHCVADHEKHFITHCWVCGNHVKDHLNVCEGTSIYVCCSCGLTSRQAQLYHNPTHRPKLFCIICKEEYSAKEKDRHGKEFKCIVCKEMFQCLTILENHFEIHPNILSSNCIFCQEMLDRHEKVLFFQCCVCSLNLRYKCTLQSHLLIHTRLRIFKCAVCGQRFSEKSNLIRHLKICTPSPFKCEICRARFPSSRSVKEHCSKKHSDMK